jgi:crossover junction endodeoxyribonuclease RusA
MITLTLPYPISANRYWATRVIKSKATGKYMAMTYVTPEAREYKEQVGKLAIAAGVRTPIDGRVRVTLQLFPHRPLDWRTRQRKLGVRWDDGVQCIDLGNAEKVLSDALQGIVFTDDKWIWHQTKDRMPPDEHGARVVLHIEAIAVDDAQGDLLTEAA